MKLIYVLLFFLFPMSVYAETIESPYQEINVLEEKVPVQQDEMLLPTTTYILKKQLPEKETYDTPNIKKQTTYCYQELKKLTSLQVTTENVSIVKIAGKDKKTNTLLVEQTPSFLASKKAWDISLPQATSPEDIVLSITCFLHQASKKGKVIIQSKEKDYVYFEKELTKKSYQDIIVRPINHLNHKKWDKTVICKEKIEPFYYHFVRKCQKYRYFVKENHQQNIETISSDTKKEGYQVIEEITRYHLYKKLIITLYDSIELENYLDLNKIVVTSNVPLKKIHFKLEDPCTNQARLFLSYHQFSYSKQVAMHCKTYPKSSVDSYHQASITNQLVHYLLKLSIEKKF